MDQEQKCILISYIPLVSVDDVTPVNATNLTKEDLDRIIHKMQEVEQPIGCIWIMKNEKVVPVLVVERAAEIAEHLVAWAEEKPEEWFELGIVELDDGGYSIALMPNLRKSMRRFSVSRVMFHEDLTSRPTVVLCQPLNCITAASETYHKIKHLIRYPCDVYLLDATDFDIKNAQNTDFKRVHYLGAFERATQETLDYLASIPK